MSGVLHAFAGQGDGRRDTERFGSWTTKDEAEKINATLSATLRKTIEAEVIPRLMIMTQEQMGLAPGLDVFRSSVPDLGAEVAEFARFLTEGSHQDAVARIRGYLAQGLSSEMLLLDLLAPAARLLGERWNSDEISFTGVSAGVARLHQLLRLIAKTGQSTDTPDPAGSILLAAAPGDRHSFGLAMVEEFFRDAGWSVATLVSPKASDILAEIRTTAFDVIGLSLARVELQTDLSSLIEEIRRDSKNRGLQVLVGGPVFMDHPQRCMAVGADATAVDGRTAVIEARSLLRLSALAR